MDEKKAEKSGKKREKDVKKLSCSGKFQYLYLVIMIEIFNQFLVQTYH